jgi:hypothetical protein
MTISRCVTILVAVAAIAVAVAFGAGVTRAASAKVADDGPRNVAGESATGDTEAMRDIVQDVVDCLRAKGFHPGDPEVRGSNVVIAGWNPDLDSAAGRADHECAFPHAGADR